MIFKFFFQILQIRIKSIIKHDQEFELLKAEMTKSNLSAADFSRCCHCH